MPKMLMWLQGLRSLLLALRIIAFEKSDAVVCIVWAAAALPVVLALTMTSLLDGTAALAAAVVLFFPLREWGRRNRYRLIRTADRVEYADTDRFEESRIQRFASGVVLRRLGLGEMKMTGQYDPELMEGERWFFVVSSPGATRVVPFGWIVGIDIGAEEGN